MGSPLSRIDTEMSDLGFNMIRYADDITLFNKIGFYNLGRLLERLGVEMSSKKLSVTEIVDGNRFTYLGLTGVISNKYGLYYVLYIEAKYGLVYERSNNNNSLST